MYCKNCGNEIHDEAVVCIHCGCPVDVQNNQSKPTVKTNILALVGFILSFFVPIAGLICSILGYKRADSEFGVNGKSFAIAGTVISSVYIAVSVIAVIGVVITWAFVWSVVTPPAYCVFPLI